MGEFHRRGADVIIVLDEYECQLLPTLLGELTDLLQGDRVGDQPPDAEGGADPFALWEHGFSVEPTLDDPDFLEPDPITRRLFPDAYHDDPAASHDFRRFTTADARQSKLDAVGVVMDDLKRLTLHRRMRIPADHLTAWMTSINNLRLVFSVVLGITDELSADEASRLPDEDPRGVMFHYYTWLGWMLESLMTAMAPRRQR